MIYFIFHSYYNIIMICHQAIFTKDFIHSKSLFPNENQIFTFPHIQNNISSSIFIFSNFVVIFPQINNILAPELRFLNNSQMKYLCKQLNILNKEFNINFLIKGRVFIDDLTELHTNYYLQVYTIHNQMFAKIVQNPS